MRMDSTFARSVAAVAVWGLPLVAWPAGTAPDAAPPPAPSGRSEAYDAMARVARGMALVRARYVDAQQASFPRLGEHALRGIVENLDPYGELLDTTALREVQESAAGEFGGAGILISPRGDRMIIAGVIPGGPADRAGVLPGDELLLVSGDSVSGLTVAGIAARTRGEAGTRMELTLQRSGESEPRRVTMERSAFELAGIPPARMIRDGIGWIRIPQFDDRTPDELDRALRDLHAGGMRALILDLRDCPGGLMQGAVGAASRFLPRGARIVETRGRAPDDQRTFNAQSPVRPFGGPLVVLVNEGTASAAEVMAGALQDHGRARLVGEQTYGKAMVQSILPIEDGWAMRLTTALYYTPRGRMIQGKGIAPDLAVAVPLDTRRKIWMSWQRAEESPRPPVMGTEDPQMERAIQVLGSVSAAPVPSSEAGDAKNTGIEKTAVRE